MDNKHDENNVKSHDYHPLLKYMWFKIAFVCFTISLIRFSKNVRNVKNKKLPIYVILSILVFVLCSYYSV